MNKLKEHFPMLRERSELLAQIHSRKELLVIFQQWTKEQQNEFLDFCCGERGVKILYDSVFMKCRLVVAWAVG